MEFRRRMKNGAFENRKKPSEKVEQQIVMICEIFFYNKSTLDNAQEYLLILLRLCMSILTCNLRK